MQNILNVQTPCYVIDEAKLIQNLEILKSVKDACGCKILLAQKAFSAYWLYPLIGQYLDGTCASSLYEAKLGREEMGGEVHIFAPAYRDHEFAEIAALCDHIIFNSPAQLYKYKDKLTCEIGIRVNPGYSEIATDLYNPCASGSRLGMTPDKVTDELVSQVDGIHFHAMCEQNSDTLERVLASFEKRYAHFLNKVKWVNFGGGHHITRADYDLELLIQLVSDFKQRYGVQVYLEPGEAIALNAGYLVTTVLDIIENDKQLAIIDASAACHMPDVLEMPYRPNIIGAGKAGELPHTYRLGGNTCLAGDVVGDYSFEQPLKVGDKLILCDMAIYTMVKNNTFNGIGLPDIALSTASGDVEVVKQFGYKDFKQRL